MVNKMPDDIKNKKLFDDYKELIYLYFNNVGPKSKLGLDDKEIFLFEDNIHYNFSEYYNEVWHLKDKILDKIPEYKGEINFSSTCELFDYLCKFIYQRIKSRKENINDILKVYLIDEDVVESFSEMHNKLADSSSNHKFVFITNSIFLKDFDTLSFGNITIGSVNKNNINWFPKNIDYPYVTPLSRAIAQLLDKPITHEEFIDKYEGNVFLEINMSGYHFNDEKSEVFQKVIFEYRQLLSYFLIFKEYSDLYMSIRHKENVFKSKKIISEDKVFNYAYVKLKDENKLKSIEGEINEIGLFKEQLIINKEVLELMKKIFYIDNFLKISQNKDYGKLSEKFRHSLDWFLKANEEKNETNKAIALFISLESLMSTGSDSFTSFTNELAENIVIACFSGADFRLEEKNIFKREIYPLRNSIMHHGHSVVMSRDADKIVKLKIYLDLTIRWFLKNIDKINEIGNNSKALKVYFELKKLK